MTVEFFLDLITCIAFESAHWLVKKTGLEPSPETLLAPEEIKINISSSAEFLDNFDQFKDADPTLHAAKVAFYNIWLLTGSMELGIEAAVESQNWIKNL